MTSERTLMLVAQTASAALVHFEVLAGLVTADIEQQLPELASDGTLRDALGVTIKENLQAALGVLIAAEEGTPPAPRASLDHARRLAQRGVALSSLLRAYRLGQAVFQQYMIAEIATASTDAALIAESAQLLSSVAFSYIDRTSGEVVQAYQTERDYWQHQRIAARAAQLDALLSGTSSDLAGAERALGYVLEQQHLAVVIWSDRPDTSDDQLPALERAAGALATAAKCAGSPLVVARDVGTVWGWLPSPLAPPQPTLPAGVRVAVGTEHPGLRGFRLSHDEALETQRVAMAAAPDRRRPILRAGDVGPLGLLTHDGERLRSWVSGVLGPLATDDPGTEALRETLEVFLANGRSYVHAGETLMLHRNSVQYRIKKATEAVGEQALADPINVQLALLAARVLGSPVLHAPD